ncbi:unnamed protein product [Heterobilharzia americana]|nr:unnamed protein product [Heterobilharzia americana]
MEWIAKAICKITNLKRDTLFSIYYYGDHEFVQITSKLCLKRMVKYFSNCGQICRIYAIPHAYSDRRSLNSFFSFCKADELPNILLKRPQPQLPPPATPRPQQETVTSHTLTPTANQSIDSGWLSKPCKLCDKVNWLGERYTCLFCTNIVLCKGCFQIGYHRHHHNAHPILCTRDTKLFSHQLLQYSRLAVACVPWNTTTVLPKITTDSRLAESLEKSITSSITSTKQTLNERVIMNKRNGSSVNNHDDNDSKTKKRSMRLTLFKLTSS